MNSTLPPLSATSPDDVLMAAIDRTPNLLRELYGEASVIQHRLTQNPHLPAEFGVANFWQQSVWRFQVAMPAGQIGMVENAPAIRAAMVSALRTVLDTRDALRDLEADIPLLNHSDMLALRGQVPPDAAAATLAALWNKGPGLRSWKARQKAAAEAAQATLDATRERQAEAFAAHSKAAKAEAARTLLRRLAADGVHLAVAKQNLLAHPAALLTDEHRAALAEFRAELVAILAEQPEIVGLQAAAE